MPTPSFAKSCLRTSIENFAVTTDFGRYGEYLWNGALDRTQRAVSVSIRPTLRGPVDPNYPGLYLVAEVLRNGGSAAGFWSKFNAGDSCQQWYYEGLYSAFAGKDLGADAQPAVLRFRAAIDRLFGDRTIEPCRSNHEHGRNATRAETTEGGQ